MKKILCLVLLIPLLVGCGATPAMETIADTPDQAVSAPVQQILLDLPGSATLETADSQSQDKLYLCDGYTVAVQTMEAGDLDRTLRNATGYGREDLTLMQTADPAGQCYRCVWASAGEGQTQVGKTCIIDDGSYHYVLTVMMPEKSAGELSVQVQQLMDSFQVVDPEFNIGS